MLVKSCTYENLILLNEMTDFLIITCNTNNVTDTSISINSYGKSMIFLPSDNKIFFEKQYKQASQILNSYH